MKLKSLVVGKKPIYVPVKYTKASRKLQKQEGKQMTSFLLSEDSVDIRWELPDVPLKTEGRTVGADQGMKDLLTLSDGQVTPKVDIHGHTLESIMVKMCRKRPGSRSMKKAQDHRRNFINWSINQLDFEGINKNNLS